mmetsp:Transcript_85408/g.169412  ORF Transcript_85408/g.169412 Transcript_85408/m.169412 type:complete len:367 (-) Transcript_85408:156-1256(-)
MPARFWEGLALGKLSTGDGTTSFCHTVLLQLDHAEDAVSGWLTRTEGLKAAGAAPVATETQGPHKFGACVESIFGSCNTSGVWNLATADVTVTQATEFRWNQYEYKLHLSEDQCVLSGHAVVGGNSQREIEMEQRLHLYERHSRPSDKLRWEGVVHSSGVYQSWNLAVLEWNLELGDIKTQIIERNCFKTAYGTSDPQSLPANGRYAAKWLQELGTGVETVSGKHTEDGTVLLKGSDVQLFGLMATAWAPREYTLNLSDHGSQLSGVGVHPDGKAVELRLRAQPHFPVQLSRCPEDRIAVHTLGGSELFVLSASATETVSDFTARVMAQIPQRGLAFDRIRIVLPSGTMLHEANDDQCIFDLLPFP